MCTRRVFGGIGFEPRPSGLESDALASIESNWVWMTGTGKPFRVALNLCYTFSIVGFRERWWPNLSETRDQMVPMGERSGKSAG
ncbi:hypothetical protein TNCV_4123441 [Trichonephila clavipes]|nr:hypothetical protein TNCV_4123441 [Trichonephila clavipes]